VQGFLFSPPRAAAEILQRFGKSRGGRAAVA
jgi:hypothetical protein